MSTQPVVIIITGESCSGKSTIGRHIAERYHLPFISRDELKELIFDSIGWSDRAWSHSVGFAGYAILYKIMELFLSTEQSIIIESTFKPLAQRVAELQKLQARHPFLPIQIFCRADEAVLIERFQARSNSEDRHPGHVDNTNIEDFRELLRHQATEQLPIAGECITIDTSDIERIDYESVHAVLTKVIS